MSVALDTGMFRRRGMRLVRQTEVAECGLASLAMVAAHHGLDIDLGTLRRQFPPSLRGVTLNALIGVADQLGFVGRAVKLSLDELSALDMPAVLHWNLNHFVVLEKVRGSRALIHNPEGRSKWYRISELSDHFTGIALELRPSEDFNAEDRRERLKLRQLWRRMSGLKRAFAQILILSLAMQAFVLASPYFMQVAIDRVVPALDASLLAVLALGFGLFTLMNAGAALLRAYVLLSAGTALSFGISANVARRLFRLPVAWFEKRHVGDILSRFQSVTPIRQALTEGAVAAFLDGGLALLTLAVMFFYSPALALLAIAAFGVYALIRVLLFLPQRDAQEESIVNRGKEQSLLIESLRGIVTLRLFGRESMRHALWQTKLTEAVNAEVQLGRISAWQDVARTLIFGLELVASIWLSIGQVIAGGFSLGMVFAYMAYKTQFLTNASSLIDKAFDFRMLGLHLERLADIALAEQDSGFVRRVSPTDELAGRIELRGIGFRYSASDPQVLRDVNLAVEPGEHVAVTGPSGGGKSTLVKIILGLLQPDEGEVLVDGVPLARFGQRNYYGQIAAVLQDDSLFAGSLGDNIAFFDDDADHERIVAAARQAAIHEEIMAMPMRYETLIGDMGSTLSGGQKQRVLLARALFRRPRLLVIDEGTSHLDPKREREINAAIANLGITRIVVAHRAESLASADRVYRLGGTGSTQLEPLDPAAPSTPLSLA